MMKKRASLPVFIVIFVIATLVPPEAMAQTVAPFVLPSARMAALGGPHAASVNGLDSMFENPAGFASEKTELSVASVVFNPSGPLFDIAGLVLGGGSDIMTLLPNVFDDSGRLYVQADILGPLAFGYVGKGLGFGMFNRTVATVNASSLLSVSYSVSEEFLLTGGYSHRFYIGDRTTIDLGLMPKGFVRGSIGDRLSLDGLMTLASDFTAALSSPLTMTTGLGVDAGVMWTLDRILSVGIVGRDAYSPALVTTYANYQEFIDTPSSGVDTAGLVSPDISIGVAYLLPFQFLERLGADVLVLADYSDILNLLSIFPRNPILNVRLGVELTLLDILSLRAGIKEALPTAGFCIDLSAFSFSLAMYGQELGMEPGSRPVYNLLMALDFRY